MRTPTRELGILGSGEKVFDRPKSHVLIHDDGRMGSLLADAFSRTDAKGSEFITETIDFGVVIGETNCVETRDGDEIRFARRKGRKGESRFVVGKEKRPTSLLTFVLMKVSQGYLLITAYYGPRVPREPWDPHAEPESEEFWKMHALTWDPGEVEQ